MANPAQKVLDWLRNVLGNGYQNPQRIEFDITQVLHQYPHFSLRTDVFTYDNGRTALLLNVSGVLPVPFRNETYNYPVSIWIPQEFPRSTPIAYVTSTKELSIRSNQYLSGEGRIYHPYLAGWDQRRSSLPELLDILQNIFAQEPPLISKPAPNAGPRAGPPQNGIPPPRPPLPPDLQPREFLKTPSITADSHPPPPPPRPHETQASPLNNNAPPVPPRPYQPPTPRRQHEFGIPTPSVSHQHQYTPSSPRSGLRSPLGDTRRQYTQRPPQGSTSQQPRPSLSPIPNGYHQPTANPQPANFYHHPDVPPSYLPSQQPRQPTRSLQAQPQPFYQSPQQIPPPFTQQPPTPKPPLPDLLTSPLDLPLPTSLPTPAPPPLAPNPAKTALLTTLSQTLHPLITSQCKSTTSALDSLSAQTLALETTLQNMSHESDALHRLDNMLSSNESLLHKTLREADDLIASTRREKSDPNKQIDIDKLLVPGSKVEEQLYEAVVEAQACVETRAMLGRGLDRSRVGAEGWARAVRGVAREEFRCKVLAGKIAGRMGLGRGQDAGGGRGGTEGQMGGGERAMEGWYDGS